MIDIDFFMKAHEFKRKLMGGGLKGSDKEQVLTTLESYRSQSPTVYNIETTNACNMRCQMCPRTTMMTRSVENMSKETFVKVVDQLKPLPKELWVRWEKFVEKEYRIKKQDMSENHFFLHIIPKVIQLHGYGDPLLDVNMEHYIKILSDRGFTSYFSCNPANINLDRTVSMLRNGLDFIKYSIETTDDTLHKKIRGADSDFSKSFKKIEKLLEIKKAEGIKTVVIITMLNLNRKDQKEDFERLKDAFKGKDVYIYLKSEDQQWYRQEFHQTLSVHWSEYCQHPWMSMTVKSNGEIAMCMEDFNNEIVLGDAKKESLFDIWNGEKYGKFRRDHLNMTPGIKCTERCDMPMLGELL